MNRFEYLGALNNCIQHELPADEYNNVMQYYSEYFADAGIEKEQEVIQELGARRNLPDVSLQSTAADSRARLSLMRRRNFRSDGLFL